MKVAVSLEKHSWLFGHMADRQTVFSLYLCKMARVFWEESSGRERLNQSGKRLKDRTWIFLRKCLATSSRKREFLAESKRRVKRHTATGAKEFKNRNLLRGRALLQER